MLIGFTGAQSTGKSTLLEQMSIDDAFRKCSFVKEVTRKVASKGLDINDRGSTLTQLFIMNEHLNNHTLTENCTVLDRCVIDGYISTKYLHETKRVDDWVLDYATHLRNFIASRIDVLLYTDPGDVKLVDDGVRSVNKQFRQRIIQLYDDFLSDDQLIANIMPVTKIVRLSGDVSSRMEQIKQSINL